MSNVVFWAAFTALWVLVLGLVVAVFLLYRYHGRMLLESREGRANQGPALDKPFPEVRARDVHARVMDIGQPSDRARFVYLAQTTCQPCKEARDALGVFAAQHRATVDTVLVCSGGAREVAEFAADLPDAVQVVPDVRNEWRSQLRVSISPFAVILDRDGIVRGKGSPVTLEAFEALVEQLDRGPQRREAVAFVPIAAAR